MVSEQVEADFVIYDTPDQGLTLVIETGPHGFKVGGADEFYGQQSEVARFPVDERARQEILDRLRESTGSVRQSECFRDEAGVFLCAGCRVQVGEHHAEDCDLYEEPANA